MQKIKKPISILLSVLMILSVFAVVPFTASAASNGNFGNLSWNLDDNGLLTFSGSGSIPMNGFAQNGDVKKVIINDSVTELGAYAFDRCSNLTEVDIQNPSVSLIGSHHFSETGVTTVTLPEGMTTISQGMFRECGALTTVDLPSTITSIADMAFMSSGLQSISVPEGATYDSSSFETDSLQSLTLEGSSPMTFTGGEFTFLSDAATVYIPEGSTYVYSNTTATLYVKDTSNEEAKDMLEDAQENLNMFIEWGYSPEKALAYVNQYYPGDYYGVNVTTEGPFTVPLNEGDKCEAVFGGATIGKYVPPAPTTYTVTWKNGDTVLKTDTDVEEGTTPTYDGAEPTKAEDAENTYTFSGWSDGTTTYSPDALPAVSADVTYTATYTATKKVKTYTITWKFDYSTVIDTTQVEEGVVPTHADPAKATDLKCTYTFTGWSPTVTAATRDTSYTAQFTENPIFYAVGDSIDFGNSAFVYNNWNKQELSGSYTIASVAYDSANYRYNLVLQSGDNTIELGVSSYGEYDSFVVKVSYGSGTSNSPYRFEIVPLGTVIWKDEDGNILETDENVPSGSKPSFDGTYTKESESPEDYYYVTRWFQEYSEGNIDNSPYTLAGLGNANFDSSQHQIVYRGKHIKVKYLKPGVTFFKNEGIDYNNSYVIIDNYSGAEKRSDNQYLRDINLAYSSDDIFRYRVERGINGGYNYTYKTYNEDLGNNVAWRCTGGDGTKDNPYTFDFIPFADVTWKLDENTVIDTAMLEWGEVPTYTGETPTKAEDANYTYTFAGWSPEITAVTGDATYTATFTAVPKGINYGGDNYINPKGTQAVIDENNFGLNMNSYLNMQMLGIQLKNSIATEGGDDGVRFVTAVNSNLLKGDNIADYGYIVAKFNADVEDLNTNMDKFTADKFEKDKNVFSCKGTSNSISGDFGQYSTETDYKYVTLAVTGTSEQSGNLIARFYVKTKDGKYHYADYINRSNQTYSGMAFDLSAVEANLH